MSPLRDSSDLWLFISHSFLPSRERDNLTHCFNKKSNYDQQWHTEALLCWMCSAGLLGGRGRGHEIELWQVFMSINAKLASLFCCCINKPIQFFYALPHSYRWSMYGLVYSVHSGSVLLSFLSHFFLSVSSFSRPTQMVCRHFQCECFSE